jgi:hypothetical protein
MIELIVGIVLVSLVFCIIIISIYPREGITQKAWSLIAMSLFIGICHVVYTIICEFTPLERIY